MSNLRTVGVVVLTFGLSLWWRQSTLRCAMRGKHDPVRQPVGGWRCSDCKTALADLGEAGYEGYVAVMGRKWDRDSATLTREVLH